MSKKTALLAVFSLWCSLAMAQVSTDPAEEIDPADSLKITVDVSKMDGSIEHVKNLQNAVDAGEDLYIWTWKPYEFPAGHPKTNGLGSQAWKNSNPVLKMTKESQYVFSWTIVPTDFYEVDAATVYQEDIHFLVKPQDGGGYGDPDIKSEDLSVAIDPPKLERDPSFPFPEVGQEDDVFTIYYENARETKPSMMNLQPGDVYAFAEATLSDSTTSTIEPSFFTVGSNPRLEMDYIGNQSFRKFIYPHEFFDVPAGKSIIEMKFVIMRKVFSSSADRTDNDVIIEIGCP